MCLVRGGYFGGNCNNGQLYGVGCSNLNNAPSNANWNIGASHSYEVIHLKKCFGYSATRKGENRTQKAGVSKGNQNTPESIGNTNEMAHTVNNLFDNIVSRENIELAVRRASRGKKKKRSVRRALANIEETVTRIREALINETYAPPSIRQAHEINDGIRLKKRIIVHPSFDELIVVHSVLQVVKSVFMRKFYRWSCGSIPGRGQESMVKYIERKMKAHPEKFKYYVKLDVEKCFDSIREDVLMRELRRHIRDRRVLSLFGRIVKSNTLRLKDGTVKTVGVPIGLYSSPWFANIVLTPIDHCIKDGCGIYLYVRYMDDMLLVHANRRELSNAVRRATGVLSSIGLKWKSAPVVTKWEKGSIGKFRFCGVHLMRERIQLHDAVYIRARRCANRIRRKWRTNRRVTWYDAAKIVSYGGRFRAFNSYKAFRRDVLARGKISYASMRRKISLHSKHKGVMS